MQNILGSGFGPLASFSRAQLAEAARVLRPKAPIPGSEQVSREGRAFQGRPVEGPIAGKALGEQWIAIVSDDRRDLATAARPLVEFRGGELVEIGSEAALLELWSSESVKGLQAICIVGTTLSWQVQETLQRANALVSRIPFDDPGLVRHFAERSIAFETQRSALDRRAAIVAPRADDGFTKVLRQRFHEPLSKCLERFGFEVGIVDGSSPSRQALAECGIIILLTHGGDGAEGTQGGEPAGVGQQVPVEILEACARGAWVLHLGCNGAGTFRGGRYGRLLAELGLEDAPLSENDRVSPFATKCMTAGARGFVGHVDSTWSNAFEEATAQSAIIAWVEWIASGRCALAAASESLVNASGKAAVDAVLQHGGGDPEASLSWLRHVDLSGYVSLGDPSCHPVWL